MCPFLQWHVVFVIRFATERQIKTIGAGLTPPMLQIESFCSNDSKIFAESLDVECHLMLLKTHAILHGAPEISNVFCGVHGIIRGELGEWRSFLHLRINICQVKASHWSICSSSDAQAAAEALSRATSCRSLFCYIKTVGVSPKAAAWMRNPLKAKVDNNQAF